MLFQVSASVLFPPNATGEIKTNSPVKQNFQPATGRGISG